MVRQVYRQSRGFQLKKSCDPDREWLFILFGTVCLLASGVVCTVIAYSRYDALEAQVTDTTSSVVRYDKATIERALERYRDKEAAFAKLEYTTPTATTMTATSSGQTVDDQNPLDQMPPSTSVRVAN